MIDAANVESVVALLAMARLVLTALLFAAAFLAAGRIRSPRRLFRWTAKAALYAVPAGAYFIFSIVAALPSGL